MISRLTHAALIDRCRRLPSAVEVGSDEIAWRTFKVRGKTFALFHLGTDPVMVTLRCAPSLVQSLRTRHRSVIPGFFFDKQQWNTVVLDGSIPDEAVLRMVRHSFARAAVEALCPNGNGIRARGERRSRRCR